jgi:hypothetical protein
MNRYGLATFLWCTHTVSSDHAVLVDHAQSSRFGERSTIVSHASSYLTTIAPGDGP